MGKTPMENQEKAPEKAVAFSHSIRGISLVEILLALGLFSISMVGLFMASSGMFESIRTAMKLDIEAAYANMLIARINPSNPLVESAYDVTTKTAQSLPDNDSFYYTQLVDSDSASPDIKRINLFLYRGSGTSTPYRQFKREIAPYFTGFDLGESTSYLKDKLGWVWAPMAVDANGDFSGVAGSRRNGRTETAIDVDGSGTCPSVTGTTNASLFQTMSESNNIADRLGYSFMATLGRNYLLKVGVNELDTNIAVGERRMKVLVNGVQVGTIDARNETGGTCSALMKTFTVAPVNDGSGLGVITVEFEKDSGATAVPRVAAIGLERTEM